MCLETRKSWKKTVDFCIDYKSANMCLNNEKVKSGNEQDLQHFEASEFMREQLDTIVSACPEELTTRYLNEVKMSATSLHVLSDPIDKSQPGQSPYLYTSSLLLSSLTDAHSLQS